MSPSFNKAKKSANVTVTPDTIGALPPAAKYPGDTYSVGWCLRTRHTRQRRASTLASEAPAHIPLVSTSLLHATATVLHEELLRDKANQMKGGPGSQHPDYIKSQCRAMVEEMGLEGLQDPHAFEKLWKCMSLGGNTLVDQPSFMDTVRNPLRSSIAGTLMCIATELATHPFLCSPGLVVKELLHSSWRINEAPKYGSPVLSEALLAAMKNIAGVIDEGYNAVAALNEDKTTEGEGEEEEEEEEVVSFQPSFGVTDVKEKSVPATLADVMGKTSRLYWNVQVLDESARRIAANITWERNNLQSILSADSSSESLESLHEHTVAFFRTTARYDYHAQLVNNEATTAQTEPNSISPRFPKKPASPRKTPRTDILIQKNERLIRTINTLEQQPIERKRPSRRGSSIHCSATRMSYVGEEEEKTEETEEMEGISNTLRTYETLQRASDVRAERDEEMDVFFSFAMLRLRYKTTSIVRRLAKITNRPLSHLAGPLIDYLEVCRESHSYLPQIDGLCALFGPPTLLIQNFASFIRTKSFLPSCSAQLAELILRHAREGTYIVYPFCGEGDTVCENSRKLRVSFIRSVRRRQAATTQSELSPKKSPFSLFGSNLEDNKSLSNKGVAFIDRLKQSKRQCKDEAQVLKSLNKTKNGAGGQWFRSGPTKVEAPKVTSFRPSVSSIVSEAPPSETSPNSPYYYTENIVEHGIIERAEDNSIVFSHGVYSAHSVSECIRQHADILRTPAGKAYTEVPWLEEGLGDGLSPLHRAVLCNNVALVKTMVSQGVYHLPFVKTQTEVEMAVEVPQAVLAALPFGKKGAVKAIKEPEEPSIPLVTTEDVNHITEHAEALSFQSLSQIEVKMLLQRIAEGKYKDDHFLLLVWELGEPNGVELLRYCASGPIKGNRLQEAMAWHPLAPQLREDLPRYRARLMAKRVNNRMTALHIALHTRHGDASEVIKILITAGCDPNRPDVSGNTPLYYAVERQLLASTAVLLREGAGYVVACAGKALLLASLAPQNGTPPLPELVALLAKAAPNRLHHPEAIRLCSEKVKLLTIYGNRCAVPRVFYELKALLQEIYHARAGLGE